MKQTKRKRHEARKRSSLKRDLLTPKYRMRVEEDKRRKEKYDWKKDYEC